MQFKEPKNTEKYYWTKHIQMKMRQYGISEARVKRILRAPLRVETGVAEETVAVMQPLSMRWDAVKKEKTWKQELWLMYQIRGARSRKQEAGENNAVHDAQIDRQKQKTHDFINTQKTSQKQHRLISVWRYPGVTVPGEGIPEEVLSEMCDIAADLEEEYNEDVQRG